MRKLIFGIFLAMLVCLPVVTFAQDESNITAMPAIDDSENLDIVLSYINQSPKSKEFDLVAEISSGIDSDRVVVEWKLPSGVKFADSLESRYSRPSVSAGQKTIVQKRLVATYLGSKEIEVVATAVKADVNYVSSDKIQLVFNEGKEIIPETQEYKDAKTMYQITQALLYIGLAAIVAGGGYFAYRWVRKIRS